MVTDMTDRRRPNRTPLHPSRSGLSSHIRVKGVAARAD